MRYYFVFVNKALLCISIYRQRYIKNLQWWSSLKTITCTLIYMYTCMVIMTILMRLSCLNTNNDFPYYIVTFKLVPEMYKVQKCWISIRNFIFRHDGLLNHLSQYIGQRLSLIEYQSNILSLWKMFTCIYKRKWFVD